MKKFLVLFIAVLSVFCFSSCEDKEEVIEHKYKLTADVFGATNIVIHEVNDNGDVLKKRSIYEIKPNEYSSIFTADEKATGVWLYYKSGIYEIDSYYKKYADFVSIDLGTVDIEVFNVVPRDEEITEEEYNFYVNQ
jgi:uncharacterized lipoprotein YehR (DUF1307 family)